MVSRNILRIHFKYTYVTTCLEILDIIMASLKAKTVKHFDRLVVIHNVGTVGDITKYANDLTDINDWRNYYDLNLFIPAILNGVVMQIFNENPTIKKTVINITSLLGITPQKSMSYYCSGKAAREMFFKVIILYQCKLFICSFHVLCSLTFTFRRCLH